MPGPGEFEIIERYFRRDADVPGLVVGIGDDAAIVGAGGPIAVAVDTIVEGTHFPADEPAEAVGHRVLAVNLSDLAAVGARPRWATLALTLPASDFAWLEGFAAGFFALADRFGVALIGGDTTRGHLTASVQVIGDAPDSPLLRAGGGPGDVIYVSGTLGDGAGGVALLGRDAGDLSEAARELVTRFRYPEPRCRLGCSLTGIATAAIDISDGLAADLRHICHASGCGAEIDPAALPLSDALRAEFGDERALELAIGGGDDYELCFAAPPGRQARIEALGRELGVRVTAIGQLVAGEGLSFVGQAGPVQFDSAGFEHFRSQ